MPKYLVAAEFIDAKTGKRIQPGEIVEISGQRREALQAAGVLGEEIKPPKAKRTKAEKDGDPDADGDQQADHSTE